MCPPGASDNTTEVVPTNNGAGAGGVVRAHSINLRLPPFTPNEPKLWFAVVESNFNIAGVTDEAERLSHTISALDPRYLVEVKDIILNPPTDNPYSALKGAIIKRLGTSQELNTRRLLEGEEIGDRKPTQYLRHLRDLGGQAVGDELVRTIWTSRLPTAIQGILATQKSRSLDEVAELADQVLEATGTRAQIHAVSTPAPSSDVSLVAQIAELTREVASLRLQMADQGRPRGRSSSRSGSQRRESRSRTRSQTRNPDYCWYHDCFGERAHKCIDPCSFSGNESGTR